MLEQLSEEERAILAESPYGEIYITNERVLAMDAGITQLRTVLGEVRSYFDDRADIHTDNPNVPNEEMKMLSNIDAALLGGR